MKLACLDLGPFESRLSAYMVKPTARLDLDVRIAGYPDGKLSFVALGGA